MSEILKVYIVGAYRAATSLQRQGNILKAAALGLEVVKLGAVAVVPHTMTQYWEGAVADEVILSMLIELMKSCDAVILVDNWVLSPGSRDEIHEAERLEDISEEDAKAEGVTLKPCTHPDCGPGSRCSSDSYRGTYAVLWNKINPKHAWGSNPFVFCYTFERVK